MKDEIQLIENNQKEIEDRFYKHLEFGTGGLRAELGAGTNRLNLFTIRRAAEGMAQYIKKQGQQAMKNGIVIAYDTRHFSEEFALEVAKTVGKHKIKVYLFQECRPTPELSFAIRYFKATAGVVITASHNPPEYNGFKVYGHDGGQIPPAIAKEIIGFIDNVEDELKITVETEQDLINQGILNYVLEEVDEAYQKSLLTLRQDPTLLEKHADELIIVYTPLHGAGNRPVREGLKRYGFGNVNVVSKQEMPDPDFSTVSSPNPEEHNAFEMAIAKGEKVNADILMATDPDADRLGVAVKNRNGKFEILTGNQLGALLLNYLLVQKRERGSLPKNGVVIKTIVTSELGRVIAEKYGIQTIDTLTGFKFIGEKIDEFEKSGKYTFLFGYEESYGYLIGDFVRDKDAVQAALLTAEMATYYKAQGKSVYQGLLEIYKEYGYYLESLKSLTLKGKEGVDEISRILDHFRGNPPEHFGKRKVVLIEDYLHREKYNVNNSDKVSTDLPKSNVIKYLLEDESWVCIRPSGTEPKCKFYFGVKKDTQEQSNEALKNLEMYVMDIVESINT
ncbi:phospho-sugar mutase [Sporosarcina sp. E16_8]|uniref:phospho-sugar mutase n=1 Tax=Sporosarcina sp. E16_8 TaxID=2789295 RepID=UPI002105783A|nr:phospho-sugar mutase [Sporosarcina sp. E16_8]